jgi:hypothetical protein
MRSAAGTAALPPALQPRTQKRRSDRRKKQDRRDKARKVSAVEGSETTEFLAAAWMDALEDVAGGGQVAEEDDSYDELDEMEDDNKKKRGKRGSLKKQPTGTLPKRFKPRSLANILLEEVNRDDGVAYLWLATEARSIKSYINTQVPPRKFCPVTGMEGIYTEPKSGIPFADLKALEQIRERPPPWMQLTGSNAYHEAAKSIRDET